MSPMPTAYGSSTFIYGHKAKAGSGIGLPSISVSYVHGELPSRILLVELAGAGEGNKPDRPARLEPIIGSKLRAGLWSLSEFMSLQVR